MPSLPLSSDDCSRSPLRFCVCALCVVSCGVCVACDASRVATRRVLCAAMRGDAFSRPGAAAPVHPTRQSPPISPTLTASHSLPAGLGRNPRGNRPLRSVQLRSVRSHQGVVLRVSVRVQPTHPRTHPLIVCRERYESARARSSASGGWGERSAPGARRPLRGGGRGGRLRHHQHAQIQHAPGLTAPPITPPTAQFHSGGGEQTKLGNLVLGGVSGTLAASVCYPLDTIRRRMQMKGKTYSCVEFRIARRCARQQPKH